MDCSKPEMTVDNTISTPSLAPYEVSAASAASWARYFPGPSPQHCHTGLPPGLYRIGIVLIGCWIFFLSGTNVALMGCVSSVPDYLATVGLASATGHARLLIGVVNSIYWVGVTVGALVVGWLSDRVGRRRALVAFGLYGLLAIPLLAALRGFAWALALRLLNGLFTGAFDSVGLNWAAESVDARRRGVAIGAQLACAAGGAGIVYFITYGLSRSSTGDVIWRLPMAFQLVYVLLVLAMVYFLPESPRWLVKVGLLDEARAVLRLLKAGLAGDGELGDAVEDDLRSIQNAIDEERAHSLSASYWDMFTRRDRVRTARRTWTALLVQFGTQAFVGASVVAGYGVAIFEAGGWPSQTAALLTGIGILTQAIFGVPGAVLSDRIGRRRAMVYGAAICATILALVGMCGFFVDKYKDTDPHKAKNYGTATVALVLLWNAVYGSTWLWCPFTYASEIFPAPSRSRGSSVGIVGLASGSFLINMVSTYLFGALGYKALFLFCGLSYLMAAMCFLWMPETTGKTLEDIDDMYERPYRSFKVDRS